MERASLVMERLSATRFSLLSRTKSAKDQKVLENEPEVFWGLGRVLQITYNIKTIRDKASSQYGQLYIKIDVEYYTILSTNRYIEENSCFTHSEKLIVF